MIQIYTGPGKGKTTAATGLAVRAVAAGKKVFFAYFNKTRPGSGGEQILLEKLGIQTAFYACRHPAFFSETTPEDMRSETAMGLKSVLKEISSEKFDIIVLDEILVSIRDGYASEDDILGILEKTDSQIEIVLTGRGATDSIMKRADLVSFIECVKHPYAKGTSARKGIEK